MATSEAKWTGGTSQTTGISSASLAAGANYLGSEIDNSTNKNRWMALNLQFTCGTAPPTAGKAIEIYLLQAIDGTNYEDGDATPTDPARGMDAVIIARAVTTAQSQTVKNISIPPFKFKILLKSELDQDATGVTALAYTYDEEMQ